MTHKRLYRPPPDLNFTEADLRTMSRPVELPAQPWRYTLTPKLVAALVRVAECAGQMRAAPLSYYRRKELEARSKRIRILWTVGHVFTSVRPEEVDAVLGGARLPDEREPIAESIRRAAIAEDALAHYVTTQGELSPELAMAYHQSLAASPRRDPGLWLRFNGRERAKLLELHRGSVPVPPAVQALFEWADEDAFIADSPVLRAATLYWGLTLLFPNWHSIGVILHHELRAGRVDPHGLLMLTNATDARQTLLDTPAFSTADADAGELTGYFERFTSALEDVLLERLDELGRVQNNEAHLPWKVVAPPDALDARIFEAVEKLGQAGSAAIIETLGREAPPLRTIQRRLQKLVTDGVLAKRGARKNAVYTLAGRVGTG